MFAAPPEPLLRLRLFGAFEVQVRGTPVRPLRGRTGRLLLALLALKGGQSVERALLRAMLWPDSDDAASSQNLRRALGDLRDALGDAAERVYAPTPRSLAFDVSPGVWVDALAFDAARRRSEPDWEEMISLHRGPLMFGCDEAWLNQEREERLHAFLDALERLGERLGERGAHAEAASHFRRLLEADPARESAVTRLMCCLADRGDHAAVVQVYSDFRLRLRARFNAEPAAETVACYRALRVRAARPPDASASSAPTYAETNGDLADASPALPVPSSNLPRPITTLLGRGEAIRSVVARLNEARLVTLVGTGGVGKTRLSVAVADSLADSYPDGVCFADLSPVTDPEFVPAAVGSACLSVSPASAVPAVASAAQLMSVLRPRRLLLILDNAEHLIEPCATLTQTLLQSCPHLTILATSREPLGLTGEVVFPVLPLPVPEEGAGTAVLVASDAVRLFVERGRAVRPDLAFDARTGPTIAEICRRLDGLPLAIELAAARLALLSPEEIAARLDDLFSLLTAGARTAPPRHRALRSVLDWSHDLLGDADRLLLRRLSVFPGRFDLTAARAVCFLDGSNDTDVLDRLTRLASRSLLVPEKGGAGTGESGRRWFRLLETVRRYAAELSEAAGETADLRERHAAHALERAEAAELHIHGDGQVAALAELSLLHDDLRAALSWWLRPDAAVGEKVLRLTRALGGFWKIRGYATEGGCWLADALARASDISPLLRAHCLVHLGALSLHRGRHDTARRAYEESLALFRMLGDAGGTGIALANLGEIAANNKRLTDARKLHEESLTHFRQAKNLLGEAYALNNLGNVARGQGALPAARDYYRSSFGLFRQLGDRIGQGYAICGMGNVARDMKDREAAARYYRQALELQEATGDKGGAAMSLNNLGTVALERGDLASARTFFEQSAVLWRETGNLAWAGDTLARLAKLAGAAGDFAGAERYHAEAAAHTRLLEADHTGR